MINEAENLVGSPSCAGERLDVWRGLAKADRSNYDSEEHLNKRKRNCCGFFPAAICGHTLAQQLGGFGGDLILHIPLLLDSSLSVRLYHMQDLGSSMIYSIFFQNETQLKGIA